MTKPPFRNTTASGFLVLALMTPAPALSQTDPPAAVVTGKPLRVDVVRSEQLGNLHGRMVHLGTDVVTITMDGKRIDIPLSSVQRIDVGGDSLINGTIAGAIILPLWCALVCGQGMDRPFQPFDFVVLSAEGAAIGALIDWRHSNKTTIYPRVRSAVAPIPWSQLRLLFRF